MAQCCTAGCHVCAPMKTTAKAERAKRASVEALPEKAHAKLQGGEIAAVLGVHNRLNDRQVMRSMVRRYHGAPEEFQGNVATDYHNEMKEVALWEFQTIDPREVFKSDPAHHPLLTMGQVLMVESAKREGRGLLFIRCPFGQADGERPFNSLDDQPHYHAQMQFEMCMNGLKWGVFYQWSQYGKKFELIDLDEEFIRASMPTIENFYFYYMVECVKLAERHLEPVRKEINNAKSRKLVAEHDELVEAIANADARRVAVLEALGHVAGNKPAVICGRYLDMHEHDLASSAVADHPYYWTLSKT